jgi:hypothetical protein
MAQIYSPWDNPQEAGGIVLASKEFEAPMPEAEYSEGTESAGDPDMMAEALSIINEQAQLIKSLTAQLTGAPELPSV